MTPLWIASYSRIVTALGSLVLTPHSERTACKKRFLLAQGSSRKTTASAQLG